MLNVCSVGCFLILCSFKQRLSHNIVAKGTIRIHMGLELQYTDGSMIVSRTHKSLPGGPMAVIS